MSNRTLIFYRSFLRFHLGRFRSLIVVPGSEIRTAALRAFFGILSTHGSRLRLTDWPLVLKVMFDLLDIVEEKAELTGAETPLKYIWLFSFALLYSYFSPVNTNWASSRVTM